MTIEARVGLIVIFSLSVFGVAVVGFWIAFAVAEIIGKLNELENSVEQIFSHYLDWVARQ